MLKPIAVITGDIHYNMRTLDTADRAVRLAISKAEELSVPFIANGDTHDTKANLRGECVSRMISTFKSAKVPIYINIGNHCKINEKSEGHALEFLKPYCSVIEKPSFIKEINSYIIPYFSDSQKLEAYLKTLPEGVRLIMHQGIVGSLAGHYIQDKSAISSECLANFRTILSHYHASQDIECGIPRENMVGLASYLGNPFTLNFGEANDPEKGYHILYEDGSLELVPLDLGRHKIFEGTVETLEYDQVGIGLVSEDKVWIKIVDKRENFLSKQEIAKRLQLQYDFKLDLITFGTKATLSQKNVEKHTSSELLDKLIDSLTNVDDAQKKRLKATWKDFT